MLKKVQFRFAKIKYTGKSIGDDIRVNINILNKTLQVDKRIKIGSTVEINEMIGDFPTDQRFFTADADITVTEKDAIFNDTNNIKKTIKVDAENTKPQQFTFIVELHENRYWINWGKAVAKFKITIEAQVTDAIKYIPDVSNGWLKVKIVDGDIVSLPAFLKVQSEYSKKKREYFTILEGIYRGQKASVSLENNKSRLLTGVNHESLIHIKYSISEKILSVGNKKYQATDHPESPWKKGWHDIELPDYPHRDRGGYIDIAARAKTWFRIGHKGESYLHAGRSSLGCIAIVEIKKWDEIYNKLIKARKGDFISVGVLEVTD